MPHKSKTQHHRKVSSLVLTRVQTVDYNASNVSPVKLPVDHSISTIDQMSDKDDRTFELMAEKQLHMSSTKVLPSLNEPRKTAFKRGFSKIAS